jgi:hypothetical protein
MPYRFNRSHQLLVRNRFCALFGSFILQDLHKEPAMNGTSGFLQDAQKCRPARPQQAKGRCVLCSVRGASERSKNAAGGLFQHPARSAVFYLPPSTNRLLHEQRPQFGTGAWHPLRTKELPLTATQIGMKNCLLPSSLDHNALCASNRVMREPAPAIFSSFFYRGN